MSIAAGFAGTRKRGIVCLGAAALRNEEQARGERAPDPIGPLGTVDALLM
jgi:hypothetical protein